jgi:hypothetical protein
MSDSDDDEPKDPTSFFLKELRNEERWDASQVQKYGQEMLEDLKNTDFSKLPERVAFYENEVKMYGFDVRRNLENKRSAVWKKTGFWMPVTILCAVPNVQAYYKIMYLTQKKIETAIVNILNGHKVTTDELLQPVFSWILGSFDRPLPAKFARKFDPELFIQNSLKQDVARGKGSDDHFEVLVQLLGFALALEARTSDSDITRQDPVCTLHEILDIWSEELENEKQLAKDQRTRAKKTVSKTSHKHKPEVPKVPTVPDSWEDAAWDDEDPSDKLKNMKVRAAAHSTGLRLLLTRLQQRYTDHT